MSQENKQTIDRWGPLDWLLASLYLAVLIFLLPRHVIARSDDFAYFEAVVQTFRSHVPASNDWYEATNFLFSSVSALAYWMTQNFYIATYGVLLAFSLGAFVALNFLMIQINAIEPLMRRLLSFFVVMMPTYLNKAVDYVGVMPAIFFFLLALNSYQSRRWAAFFAAVVAGYLVRDNALMLLALPFGIVILEYAADPGKSIRSAIRFAPGFLAVLAVAAAVRVFVPLGWFARRHTLFDSHHFDPTHIFIAFVVGSSVAFSFLIFFRAILSRPVRRDSSQYLGIALLVLLALMNIIVIRGGTIIPFEAPFPFVPKVNGYVIGALDICALAIASRGFAALPWRNPAFLVLLVGITGVSLRGSWWDYYFLEIILLSLLLALSEKKAQSGSHAAPRWAVAVIVVILACDAGYVIFYKKVIERAEQTLALLEPLYRRHKISPLDVKYAPFGYAGWYQFQPYIHQAPTLVGVPTAMTNENGVIQLRIAFHERDTNPLGCKVLQSGKSFSIGMRQFYAITRCEGKEKRFPVISGTRTFPMNNAEWDAYIRNPGPVY